VNSVMLFEGSSAKSKNPGRAIDELFHFLPIFFEVKKLNNYFSP
jgi:hypothetical protein